MMRVLQINIGERRAAHDLMSKTANSMKADILAVSEPNKILSHKLDRWYLDSGERAAIVVLDNYPIDVVGTQMPDFCWIETKKLRIYSCYFSPSRALVEYNDFLNRLERSIRRASVPVMVMGDFNAHSPLWGSPWEDTR